MYTLTDWVHAQRLAHTAASLTGRRYQVRGKRQWATTGPWTAWVVSEVGA